MTKNLFSLFVFIVFVSTQLVSQTKTGTSVGAFLSIEPSSRIAAMGNAGVTLYNEPQAAYYNPGSMGFIQGSAVQFTHSVWLADIAYDYGVLMFNVDGVGNVFVSITSLNGRKLCLD